MVAIAYEPKVAGFWRQMGVADFCLPADATPERMHDRINRALEQFPRERTMVRLRELQAASYGYGELALSLVG